MNRRNLLAGSSAGIATGIGGCLDVLSRSSVSDPDENEPEDTENGAAGGGLRVVGVYADDADREFIDGEYLLFENVSDTPLDVSGCVVEYPSGQTYRIGDLVLEPGARLVLLSRSGRDGTLLSSPPAYLRHAGFDAGSAESALGENGTVRVKTTYGAILTDVDYENGGCDGGTGTTGSGDEIECPY